MEDMERYGDYNDIEYDTPKKSNLPFLIIKILTAVVCIGVIGILAFRMILFNTYPSSVKGLYFDDALTAYYDECGGEIDAKTQSLRASYDDPDLGNFFADNLIVIEGAGQLQISLKYNASTLTRISEKYYSGAELDSSSTELFTFRLVDNYGSVYEDCTVAAFESRVMYRYAKLVFNGVDFSGETTGNAPEWIRLEIFVEGREETDAYSMICVYENNEDYSTFTEYRPSSKERPE